MSKIVGWWEFRRIPYNLIVGIVGLISLTLNLWLWGTYLEKAGDADDFSPLLSIIAFGLLANFFYTAGWIVELFFLKIRKRGSKSLGPRLFRIGLIFSIAVTLSSGLLMLVMVAIRRT